MPMIQRTIQRNDLTFYDQQAPVWWQPSATIFALHHLNPLRFNYFDRHISNWQGLQVLDVGCGGGFTCEFLAERGAIVTGIDQSQPCIQSAQAHAAQADLAIAYHHGQSEHLPYAAQTFDVVTCVDVLEHVNSVPQTLTEIHRVLKTDGFFCFDTINRTAKSRLVMIWLLELILREIPVGIHDWQKFIRPDELTHWLNQIGFTQPDIRGFNLFGSSLLGYLSAYWHYRRTGTFTLSLDDDTSVMYIGLARRGHS